MSSGSISRMKVLSLYRQLIRESQKFTSYNFRNYALRRIRDSFRDNKALNDSALIESQLQFGQKNLEMIRRQVLVSQLYQTDKLVIEQSGSSQSP
ncbi:LYR motif-containing protein 4-like [Uranotaenia lowii]|uniref:LYR motif-containing protein 4-like n=1 Tax=Uranotaenia lowii TaxID=190385 RepID=UPI002479D1CE|nr:LYR motif-containing protein 4-like [Uranotaenia lowii]